MFKLLMWEVVRVTYDNFKDYMYYLLTSPFKRVKKSINNWYILCEVLGSWFDECMIFIGREKKAWLLPVMILCFQFMLQTVE